MKVPIRILAGSILASLSLPSLAASALTELNQSNTVLGVSRQGEVVFGESGLLWSESSGFRPLQNYDVQACANSGTQCVGQLTSNEGFLWDRDNGFTSLNTLFGASFSYAGDISADGSIIVGHISPGGDGYYWSQPTGPVVIPPLDTRPYTTVRVSALSSGGDYVAGTNIANFVVGSTPEYEAFLWTQSGGIVGLGDLPGGGYYSVGNDVAENGTVVGQSETADGIIAFRWTQADGMISLGALAPGCNSEALAVSADGNTVVGESCSGSDRAAFIWTPAEGMRNLADVLETDYGVDLNACDGSSCRIDRWSLRAATGVSADGKTIAGWGYNPYDDRRGWMVQLDRATSPDQDRDGLTDLEESSIGTSPNNPDTDADSLSDGLEFGQIIPSSIGNNGAQANDKVTAGKLSRDGRYSVFITRASNLVTGDTNNQPDVFLRDHATDTVTRLSLVTGQELATGVDDRALALSDDARFVVFGSNDDELLPVSSSFDQLFLLDRNSGLMTLVTGSVDGGTANGQSLLGSVSGDGRYVAFSSRATNLVPGDTNGVYDIFVYDSQLDTTERVSVGLGNTESDDNSFGPQITPNGRFVTYQSRATNLIDRPVVSATNAYLYDRQTLSTQILNVSSNDELSVNRFADAFGISISDDGSAVAFNFEGDLVDTNNSETRGRAYLRDLTAGVTQQVSNDSGRVSGSVWISADGQGIAYAEERDLHEDDRNQRQDVYFWDRSSNGLSLISISNTDVQGIQDSRPLGLSGDARFVLLASQSRNLVPNDVNEVTDLFVAATRAASELPNVEISSPAGGAVFSYQQLVDLVATASDPIDGDITGLIDWTSDRDGFLGSGSPVQTGLTVGSHVLVARVTGTSGTNSSAVYGISVVNSQPLVTLIEPTTGSQYVTGEPISFAATASDLEDGSLDDVIAWESNLTGELGIGASLVMLLDAGTHIVSASATDELNLKGSTSVSITVVNEPPGAFDDQLFVDEGATVVINVTDNDGDSFEGLDLTSLRIVDQPNNGTVSVNSFAQVTYTHGGGENTSDSFSYTIDDLGGARSNVANVMITIDPVNDVPVAVNDGVTVAVGETVVPNIAGNDSDADDGLDLGSIQIVVLPTHGAVTVNGDGTVSYAHDGSEAANDSFTYLIRDLSGAASNVATVQIAVEDPSAVFPIEVDFANGLPSAQDGWSYYSSNTTRGRVQVVNGRLRMDVNQNGQFSLNEATLTADLRGASQVTLNFFQSDHGDELTSMPAQFSGHHNSDGVAVSNDGVTWYRAIASSALDVSSAGQNYSIDLDAVISDVRQNYDAQFGYSEQFQIKFQQYDNYQYPTDGREWDNILIDGTFSDLSVDPLGTTAFTIPEADIGLTGCQIYTVTNQATSDRPWSVSTSAAWLTISPTNGTLAASAQQNIDVCWDSTGFVAQEVRSAQVDFLDVSEGETQSATLELRVLGDTLRPPFAEGFSAGLPTTEQGFEYYSSNASRGRIAVVNGRLRMDVNQNGSFSLNEAVLTIDLSGLSGVQLSFFQMETSDELHSLPAQFSGHANGDGVAISNDGVTWYRIVNASNLDVGSAGQTFNIDLDAQVANIQAQYDAGFAYGPEFRIKFQQYDNYSSPTDGREWDNIAVSTQ